MILFADSVHTIGQVQKNEKGEEYEMIVYQGIFKEGQPIGLEDEGSRVEGWQFPPGALQR